MARRALTADDEFRIIGGIKLLKRAGETEIAWKARWFLVYVPDVSNDQFSNFKLFRNQKARKRLWHLNWHKQQSRFCAGRDVVLLSKHYPEMAEWAKNHIYKFLLEAENAD
jgi:hypothetical protein